MAKIIKNFYHAGKWYFPGDDVEGTAEAAARSVGCVAGPEAKMLQGAPENKAVEEIEDGRNDN